MDNAAVVMKMPQSAVIIAFAHEIFDLGQINEFEVEAGGGNGRYKACV
jgi:hypothetical protein